jgi:yeast amino acid transporter
MLFVFRVSSLSNCLTAHSTCSITLPIFAVSYIAWKYIHKTKWVSLDEMDFTTGRRELDEIDEAERLKYGNPTTWWGRLS